MSDNSNFGFAKLVPGFDFLQSLAKGASRNIPQMPNLSSWVAPTLNIEELEKRIGELKAVHFWLEQNGKALAATIQALEVQKMTLSTLQGMNVRMADVANSLKAGGGDASAKAEPRKAKEAAAPTVDPLQWWGSLTQQFQEIAANAMQDVAQKTTVDGARNAATGAAREAMKAATGMANGMAEAVTSIAKAGKSPAPAPAKKKTAARKSAPGKSRSRT